MSQEMSSIYNKLSKHNRTDAILNTGLMIAAPLIGTKLAGFFFKAAEISYSTYGLAGDNIAPTVIGGLVLGTGIGVGIKKLCEAVGNVRSMLNYKYEASLYESGMENQDIWRLTSTRKEKQTNLALKIGTSAFTIVAAGTAIAAAKGGVSEEMFAPSTLAAAASTIGLWGSIVKGYELNNQP